MRHRWLPLMLLGATGVAAAEGWSDYDAAFPGLPCTDGWAACLVDGKPVTPGMVLDGAGRPHPADMRFGFWDFDALPSLSPFTGLSAYTGEGVAMATRPEADDGPTERAPVRAAPVDNEETRAARAASEARRAEAAAAQERAAEQEQAAAEARKALEVAKARAESAGDESARQAAIAEQKRAEAEAARLADEARRAEEARQAAEAEARKAAEDEARRAAELQRIADQEAAALAETQRLADEAAAAQAAQAAQGADAVASTATTSTTAKTASTASVDASCDDLIALEAPAMMGQLGVGRRKCLEGNLSATQTQTQKSKISRVLINDAQARGDKADWERLMKRHLEQIDRSDPNLCFTYAIHLSRGGAGRAHGVIRWADYALENKQQWSGNTYKKNVYNLLKLKAQAANRLWQSAEAQFVEERNDENEAKAAKYRGISKDYAREWLDYAKASGQDTKTPLSLCVSAAGNKEFCTG